MSHTRAKTIAPVDISKAREALYRFCRGVERKSIPAQRDDDDFLISNALDELETLRTRNQVRESVRQFAYDMERKLEENDHKGGWTDCDPLWLRQRLYEELDELSRAQSRLEIGKGNVQEVIDEAADVANFAMMIADIARQALAGDS